MKAYKRRLNSAKDLLDHGLIEDRDFGVIDLVSKHYSIGLSDHIVANIDSASNDPIALQYIPQAQELESTKYERSDPIGDETHSPVKGIVHRYPDRVLLKIVEACPVYCRYCFRREMVGQGNGALSTEELNKALDYIKAKTEISEVILTGGDPFILSAKQLNIVISALDTIPNVRFIRIHTRTPISDPERISNELCEALEISKPIYICLHINHSKEMTQFVRKAIRNINKTGATLLSQSVLLKNINDNTQTLYDLFKDLLSENVKPYYIHHPDLAKGTKHFRLPLKRGMEIMKDLQGQLSGIAIPHYMLDIPGGYGKIPVNESYIREQSKGHYELTDYQGKKHSYKDDCDE